MPQGLQVWDDSGKIVLDTTDYTFNKIFEAVVPGVSGNWVRGVQTEYYPLTIPGYSANTCFVIISPQSYVGGEQPGYAVASSFVPYYRDMGGETIGIIRYAQDSWYDISNGVFRQRYMYSTRNAIVEVFQSL